MPSSVASLLPILPSSLRNRSSQRVSSPDSLSTPSRSLAGGDRWRRWRLATALALFEGLQHVALEAGAAEAAFLEGGNLLGQALDDSPAIGGADPVVAHEPCQALGGGSRVGHAAGPVEGLV